MNSKLYGLTNPQKNIWNTEQYYNGTSINNIGGTVYLKCHLDFAALSNAVSNVIVNHDNFHIKLVRKDNDINQTFVAFDSFPVEIIDLADISELASFEEKLCQKVFSLENDNLFCVKIFRLPDSTGGVISVMHHIISDSWTVGLFCKEIVQEYTNLIKNVKSDDVKYSYINYINKEQEYLNSSSFEKDKEYWAEVFNTVPELATIPSFSAESSNQVSCTARRQKFAISKQVMDKVSEFCKNNRISIYNFFMSIFSIYIGRVSNLDDFVIGTPILNRLDFADKNTNGMFISTVPLRVNILNDSSFVDFSKSMARSCLSMLRHQRYPYQNILEDLRKLDSSIPNLYNVALSYQITNTVNDEIDCDSHWVFNGTCADDLQIHMVDYNSTGLNVFYDYKTSKYDVNDINNIHNRIENMINQVLSNNEINVSDIEIVTPEEKSQILNDFNNWEVELPNNKNVIELFEDQVAQHPDTTAVVLDDVSLTYNELNQKANQLARYLQENGIQNNDIVGVCFNKNIDFIISILAILKCGGVYLPISVEYPEDRISYIVDNSKARIVISNKEMSYLENKTKIVNFYNINLDSFDTSNLNIHYDNTHLCYIIYTSGSTGNPKGVMLSHKNLINFAYTFNDCFNNKFSINDSCLSLTSVSFDVSICELFVPLIFGSALVIYPEESLTNIDLLCKILEKDKITFLYLPPNILQDVSSYILENNIQTSMNKMLVGVESIKNGTLNEYFKINPNFEIVNGYGPTETTICTTFYKYVFSDNTNGVVPIGRPFANNKLLVISRGGSLQPVLTPGELYVCGNNVSSGYLNNPELTAKSFVNYKYTSEALSYRTGDIVYWDNSGLLHFIGRKDFQIKIKGHRIELSEINNTLRGISGIKNSITVVKKVNNFDTLCAYVVLENKSLTVQEIKSILFDKLPSYMVPTYITLLDSLPITINGKVDKKKLPDIVIEHTGTTEATTDTEIKLKEIFETMLDTDIVSIDDSLFNMGLDSLMAIKFSVAAHKVFGIYIDIKDLYKYDSIRALADFVDNQVHSNKNYLPEIQKTDAQDFYPLSSGQKRIYYACKMAGNDNIVYNTPGAILVDSILNKETVESAFKDIIKRQSIFRTVFVIENEEVKQKVLDNVDFAVESFNNTSSEIDSLVNNFAKPFDLEKAPLLRVEIHYIDNKETLLLFDSHHIVMDGVSLNILVNDLFKLYNSESIEPLEVEYTDYSVWENTLINEDKFSDDKKYWLDCFKDFDFETLNLPFDYTVPANQTYTGNKLYNHLEQSTIDEVSAFAKGHHVSTYSVFLTALFVTLYKYTGQTDIVIGSPVANRSIECLQNIIGMFVNNIALRTKILENQSVSDLITFVNNTVTGALDHQIYPYDVLVKDLQVPVDHSRNPLFDVVLTYQNQEDTSTLTNNKAEMLPTVTNTAKFAITLEIAPKSNQINLEYRSDLFKENTMTSFLKHYLFVLKQIIEGFNDEVQNVNIITDDEQKLLDKFNNTYGKINRAPVSKIFEEQAALHANDIAVVCDDKTLTYQELNERANSLAHLLIEKGIKPNDIVAIMTNRSLETIVCMIAILKSGAAFLNIDPTYPIERTEYYISDSKIQHVLTQRELKDKVAQIKNRIDIDLDIKDIYGKNKENPDVKVGERDLSYIIYTSGSTGTPKGVMLNQIGMSNMVQAMTRVLEYLKEGNKHAIASVTSTPFDIFVYEIIVSLTHGLKVVMANNAEHRNPKLLDALIRKHGVDVMTVTPSLMKINYDNREPDTALANVKNMVFGGEPLPEKFVKDLKALADDITVYNIYGPSEITILSNVQNLNGEKEITVGPPILNTQMYILDKNMKQLPIGVVGEIYIAGIQVGEGYIGKEEMTKQRFLKNPFGPGKIYKTGDIGRWTFDGKIQCLGRVDNQVKLRGLRIELGEIEDEILKMPGVTSAIVNKVSLDGKESLCGYYVADNNLAENIVKENLRKFLPPYMVPTYIIKLDKMPYTINRKVDRKALPLPVVNKFASATVDIRSLNSNEEKLLEIWKNILKTDKISVDDNFFDIGGDSILAINMQIEALKYGLEFEYADIFNFPTIRQLSKKLPSPEEHFMANYDYSKINNLLKANSIDNLDKIEKYNFRNALIIGSTGYLGAHILHSFLIHESGTAYCLIRPKSNMSPEDRIISYLNFYFGEDFYNNYKDRIKVVAGDLVKENLGLSESDYNEVVSNVDVVINSGAIVKHFGLKKEFEDINVKGTQYIVDLCKKNNKRLIHASTISISGFGEKEELTTTPEEEGSKLFTEHDLYVGQSIKGIYSTTKYKAEISVLEAIEDGLDAQIVRIGNITNRYSDGMFQKNIKDNAFVRRLKSFIEIGAFPKETLKHALEFTPVDLCADAIIKILEYSSPCNVFHIYNPNLMPAPLLYNTLLDRGFEIIPVTDELMSYIITGILEDNKKKDTISGIIQDIDKNKKFTYTSKVRLDCDFTNNFLNKVGFNWVSYDSLYINKCFDYFKKVHFIEGDK